METVIETRRSKVDLANIIEFAVDRCKAIDSWNKEQKNEYASKDITISTKSGDKIKKAIKRPRNGHTPSVKRKYYKRVHNTVEGLLSYNNKSITHKDIKIDLKTYTSYVSDVRGSLQERINKKHFSLSKTINELSKEYPEYKGELDSLLTANAREVSHVRMLLLDKLIDDDSLNSSELRAKLTKIEVHHELVKLMKVSSGDASKRKKEVEDSKIASLDGIKPFNYKLINKIITDGLKSDDFYELVTAVALATGRRAIEVARIGEFSVKSGNDDGDSSGYTPETSILYKNAAKKSKSLQKDNGYIIPTNYDAQKIVDAVKKLRSTPRYLTDSIAIKDQPKSLHNAIINRRIANGLNEFYRESFGFVKGDGRVFKDTRAIAGAIAVDKFGKGKNRNLFLQQYFIHENRKESVDYDMFEIDYESPAPHIEVKKKLTRDILYNADVSYLELLSDDLSKEKGAKAIAKLHLKLVEVMKQTGFALTLASIYKGKVVPDEHLSKIQEIYGGDKSSPLKVMKTKTKTVNVIKIGGSQATIKKYLNHPDVADYIKEFHQANGLKVRAKK